MQKLNNVPFLCTKLFKKTIQRGTLIKEIRYVFYFCRFENLKMPKYLILNFDIWDLIWKKFCFCFFCRIIWIMHRKLIIIANFEVHITELRKMIEINVLSLCGQINPTNPTRIRPKLLTLYNFDPFEGQPDPIQPVFPPWVLNLTWLNPKILRGSKMKECVDYFVEY